MLNVAALAEADDGAEYRRAGAPGLPRPLDDRPVERAYGARSVVPSARSSV